MTAADRAELGRRLAELAGRPVAPLALLEREHWLDCAGPCVRGADGALSPSPEPVLFVFRMRRRDGRRIRFLITRAMEHQQSSVLGAWLFMLRSANARPPRSPR